MEGNQTFHHIIPPTHHGGETHLSLLQSSQMTQAQVSCLPNSSIWLTWKMKTFEA